MIRVFEANQGIRFLVQVAVTWRETVAEHMQNPEIDLVGAVRIGRVSFGFDVGSVVVKQIEYIVALVLVGADDLGIDGHVVG
jgi:hypothetical protein